MVALPALPRPPGGCAEGPSCPPCGRDLRLAQYIDETLSALSPVPNLASIRHQRQDAGLVQPSSKYWGHAPHGLPQHHQTLCGSRCPCYVQADMLPQGLLPIQEEPQVPHDPLRLQGVVPRVRVVVLIQ